MAPGLGVAVTHALGTRLTASPSPPTVLLKIAMALDFIAAATLNCASALSRAVSTGGTLGTPFAPVVHLVQLLGQQPDEAAAPPPPNHLLPFPLCVPPVVWK